MSDFTDPIHQPIETQPTNVHTDDTADKMLDRLGGESFFSFGFLTFVSDSSLGHMYNYWLDSQCADPRLVSNRVPVLGKGPEMDQMKELRTINWGTMWARLQRLDNLKKSCEATPAAVEQVAGEVHNAWKTAGGGHASDAFTKIKKAATDAQQAFDRIHASLDKLRTNSRTMIDTLSKFDEKDGKAFLDKYCGKDDNLDLDARCKQVDNLKAALSGNYKVAGEGWFDDLVFGPFEPRLFRPFGMPLFWNPYTAGDIEDKSPNHVAWPHIQQKTLTVDFMRSTPGIYLTMDDNFYANDSINYLNEFAANYEAVARNFRSQVEQTHSSIASLMRELTNTVDGVNLDPFATLTTTPEPKPETKPKPEHKPAKKTTTDTGDQGQTSTSSSNTPSDTGTSSTSNSNGQSNGTPSQQGSFTPPPTGLSGEHSSPQNGTTTPPQTGTTDPSQTGGTPPSQTGGTTQPQTPTVPSQPTMPTGAPETVTITGPNGQRIQLTSPNGQGHMKLTVDDGTGHPKSYDVNFGSRTGVTGQPGTGTPGTGQPGTGQQQGTGQQGTGQQGTGQPGTGQPGTGQPGEPGKGGEQQVRADPSGHAVIHAGKETITIDRSATDPGHISVTLDDGTGHPTTYTVDISGGTGQDGGSGGLAFHPDGQGSDLLGGGTSGAGDTSGAGLGGSGGSGADLGGGGSTGGDLPGGGTSGADPAAGGVTTPASVAAAGGPGVADMAQAEPLSPGSMSGADPSMTGEASGPGVAEAPGANPGAAAPGGPGVASTHGGGDGQVGGMPMMGGGMGGGQGGDTEHGSQWRTEGDLFDDLAVSAAVEIAEALTGVDNEPR